MGTSILKNRMKHVGVYYCGAFGSCQTINNIMSRLRYNPIVYNARPWDIRSINDPFNLKPTNVSNIENDQNSNTVLIIFDKDNSTVLSTSVQPVDHQDDARKSRILDDINQIMSEIKESKMKDERDLSRKKRDIEIEAQNHTTTEDERNGNNTVDVQRKSRRLQRQLENIGRDPAVVTFVGAIPEQDFQNTAYVGPWIKSNKDNGSYDFNKFYLAEENYSIEVTISGLYMISVQIFYFGKSTSHSYWVVLNSEGSSMKQKLITCASASVSSSEISCYTGLTTYLRKGDRLSIQQQERNRFVNLREGYSQVQLVLLSNDKNRKRPNNKDL
ncbi:hypothetical protein EAG_13702 [Camponotus floridanus]|uniref:THD domain-containing protein n=1 Tax=Camponotus floridanus TaxID=104421 RepID=E2A4X1_CAMFO|nr:hypothetical protein EAG_13702 [Camponotus floridanus]